MLDAGLACIEAYGIEATSVTAVAERAGTSIGAIYFRFGDKEGFIQAALQRGFDRIRAETEALLAQAVMQGKRPEEVIYAFVDLAVQIQRNSQGVFRAVLKRALDDPRAWEPVGRLGNDVSARLLATLERFPEVSAIPDWQHKVLLGIHAARTAHFNSLYNLQAPLPSDHKQLVTELRELVVRFLGLPAETAPDKRRTKRSRTGQASSQSENS